MSQDCNKCLLIYKLKIKTNIEVNYMSILRGINLVKMYGQESNTVKALDNVNIEINEGEFVAIVGTSGSGKSTLIKYVGRIRQTN